MPNTKFSGIVKVERDAVGSTFSGAQVDLGEISDQSSFEPESPQDAKNTLGQAMYAGQFRKGTIVGFDLSKFAAMQAIAEADTKQDLRLSFPNEAGTGNEVIVVKNVLLEALEIVTPTSAGGRNTWRFNFRGYSTKLQTFS